MKSLHGGSSLSNAPACCGLENMPLTTIKHLGGCWTFADSAPQTKNAVESTIPKGSKSETCLSQSRCVRSCCSRCCSPGRFRDRGLVVAVAARGKNMQKKTHEMLRKIVAVFGLQNLSEVSESFRKDRGTQETGIGE